MRQHSGFGDVGAAPPISRWLEMNTETTRPREGRRFDSTHDKRARAAPGISRLYLCRSHFTGNWLRLFMDPYNGNKLPAGHAETPLKQADLDVCVIPNQCEFFIDHFLVPAASILRSMWKGLEQGQFVRGSKRCNMKDNCRYTANRRRLPSCRKSSKSEGSLAPV